MHATTRRGEPSSVSAGASAPPGASHPLVVYADRRAICLFLGERTHFGRDASPSALYYTYIRVNPLCIRTVPLYNGFLWPSGFPGSMLQEAEPLCVPQCKIPSRGFPKENIPRSPARGPNDWVPCKYRSSCKSHQKDLFKENLVSLIHLLSNRPLFSVAPSTR